MKKTIASLLVICMSLILCAAAGSNELCSCGEACDCRIKELTSEEKEQIFYEVAKEKGVDLSIIAKTQESNSTKNEYDDVIVIEEVKIEKGHTYKVKIRNNYKAQDGETPNRIMLEFLILDKQGDVLERSYLIYEGLEYEQGGWSAISCPTDVSNVGSLKFIGYLYQHNTNNMTNPFSASGSGIDALGGGNFTNPIVVSIEDIEIVN